MTVTFLAVFTFFGVSLWIFAAIGIAYDLNDILNNRSPDINVPPWTILAIPAIPLVLIWAWGI